MTTELEEKKTHIPDGVVGLDSETVNFQLRLGLQGDGGTGKTHAATTFTETDKEPLFISFNRGLVSHIGNPKIKEAPFWDAKWVDKVHKRPALLGPPARKDALIKFLHDNASKFTKNQVIIFDASTDIEYEYHKWWDQNKESFLTGGGQVDHFKEWRFKIAFFGEIMSYIKEIVSDVVYIVHEYPDPDSNLRIKPLMTGQFQGQIVSHFTDWYRAHSFAKTTDMQKFTEYFSKSWGYVPNKNEIDVWMASTPPEHHAFYLWQTQSDNHFKAKCSLVGAPKFILAHAKSLGKYKRVATTTPTV